MDLIWAPQKAWRSSGRHDGSHGDGAMGTKKMSLRHRQSGDGDTKGRFWKLCGVPPSDGNDF